MRGYLAERLCGIYYEWLKTQPGIRAGELPKTLFKETAPKAVLEPVYPAGVPIVLIANDKCSPYLDIMIRSVIVNASPEREYDIIILYNDISEKNQHLISMAARDKQNIILRCGQIICRSALVRRDILPPDHPGNHAELSQDSLPGL